MDLERDLSEYEIERILDLLESIDGHLKPLVENMAVIADAVQAARERECD